MRAACCIAVIAMRLGAQGVWESRASYPISLTELSSAPLNGKIYSVCGITPSGSTHRLFIYDPRIDRWTAGADSPIAGGADHCNLAAAEGKLYLLGALTGGSADGNTYEYDPATDRWQRVAQMNTARGASGVAASGNKIYVAGGLAGGRSVSTFEVFDTRTRTWASLPDMPTARDHLTAQVVSGKFYAIAGRASGDLRANEEFDLSTNSWRQLAPIPTARGGLGSGTLGGRIQVFGGEGNSGTPENTFHQNEEYDPAVNVWRNLAPMPLPRHGLYGATLDDRIFVPGGGPGAGATFSTAHDVFYLPPAMPPSISGLRNAASFDAAIAPGALVSLFGTRLSFGEQEVTSLPLPNGLNAVSVKVNGTLAPLLFTGPTQINLLLPENLQPGQAGIIVSNTGSESVSFTATIADTAPGIFTMEKSGQGQGAILIAGTGLIARATPDTSSRAARRGDVVEIYCTGLGRTVENRTQIAPSVTIGGVQAEVLFSGLTPGFAGLYQVNARVPSSTNVGPSVPVILQAGGRNSNTATMAVVE
jgi:uncharacterized protein (TIGR03437 family)